MIFDAKMAEYVYKVVSAHQAGQLDVSNLTNECPECERSLTEFSSGYEDDHVVMRKNNDGNMSAPVFIIIACEGYWMVNPALVGLDRGTWMSPEEQMPDVHVMVGQDDDPPTQPATYNGLRSGT